jgi:insertion element IS1 protein InsB
LCTTLLAPDPEDPTSTILEPYQLWSFVLKKARASWIWIALCRQTRQVVAYAVGDRSRQDVSAVVGSASAGVSPGPLLNLLFEGVCFGHPGGAATAVGKETGESAHVERWNNTLRERLARFVRMTLSFSKSEVMHDACLLLFLHRYNRERAILLK